MIATYSGRKRSVSHRAIVRRAALVGWAKRLLPAAALALLTSIVLWPEFSRLTETSQTAYRHMLSADAENGALTDVRYRGADERGQPYTVTAASGRQLGPTLIRLDAPTADVTLAGGSWVLLQAANGLYAQHDNLLDLAGDVVLYRDDGTFLRTAAATLDLKAGFAAGGQTVSVEGPFGTLDATGFAASDKGAVVQFAGPARLILNAKSR